MRTTLHAVGCLDERDPEVALSTAVITDDDGRTLARAHGRNAVLRDEAGRRVPDGDPGLVAHRAGAPHAGGRGRRSRPARP